MITTTTSRGYDPGTPHHQALAMTQNARPAARRIDAPRAGFFLVRMGKGFPRVPARISVEFGQFQAWIDGKCCGDSSADPVRAPGVLRIWQFGTEIEQAEYDRRLADPDRPNPYQPYDLGTARSVF